MSPLFGRQREEGKTVLILDVESGGVGACLARLSPHEPPKIFGEVRKHLPLQATHDTDALTKLILQAAEGALAHTAHVAARVRGHHALASAGTIDSAAVFLSPPWGALSITGRELEPHPFTRRIESSVESYFGPLTITVEPFGLMAAHTTPILLPSEDHYLLSVVSGEVTELILLENVGSHLHIAGHATLPMGRHYPLRTLISHGGLSETEARSVLGLYARGHEPPHALEAMHAASIHLASEFGSLAGELFKFVPARRVVVVSQEPAGEWFARSLAKSPELEHLFPEAGEVRAVRASHALPFVGMHSSRPDLPLLLEVLFVNTRLPKGQARFMSSV